MKYLIICLLIAVSGCGLDRMVIAKGEQICSSDGGLYRASTRFGTGEGDYVYYCKNGRKFVVTEEQYNNITGKVVEENMK